MSNDLVKKLEELKRQKKYLKRCIDYSNESKEKRDKYFKIIEEIQEIEKKIKFKISIERGIKNVRNNNTNKSKK